MGGFGIVVGLFNERLLGNRAEVRAVGPASKRIRRLRGYKATQAIFEAACLPQNETRKAKLNMTDSHGKVKRIGKVRIPR